MTQKPDSRLDSLGPFVGEWTTEATHPALPGVVVHGTAILEWLAGEQFLTIRARHEHPDFPDSLSVLGHLDRDRVGGADAPHADGSPLRMHYFDSRGVFRVYEVSMEREVWRWWRDAPGFSQRFTGLVSADGTTVTGRWQVREDDVHWADDLEITYRRKA